MSHQQDPGSPFGPNDGKEAGDHDGNGNQSPDGRGNHPNDDGDIWEAVQPVPLAGGTNLKQQLVDLRACKLRSKRSGRVLALTAPYDFNNAPYGEGVECRQEFPRLNRHSQNWFFKQVPGEDGIFWLVNGYQPRAGVEFVLDVYGADDVTEGARVGQAGNNGSAAQKWELVVMAGQDRWFELVSQLPSRKRLDVFSGGLNENQRIDISSGNSSDAQYWCLVQ